MEEINCELDLLRQHYSMLEEQLSTIVSEEQWVSNSRRDGFALNAITMLHCRSLVEALTLVIEPLTTLVEPVTMLIDPLTMLIDPLTMLVEALTLVIELLPCW